MLWNSRWDLSAGCMSQNNDAQAAVHVTHMTVSFGTVCLAWDYIYIYILLYLNEFPGWFCSMLYLLQSWIFIVYKRFEQNVHSWLDFRSKQSFMQPDISKRSWNLWWSCLRMMEPTVEKVRRLSNLVDLNISDCTGMMSEQLSRSWRHNEHLHSNVTKNKWIFHWSLIKLILFIIFGVDNRPWETISRWRSLRINCWGTTKTSMELHMCVRGPASFLLFVCFFKKTPAATATTHTSKISYLCIICVMKTDSSRRRCMYAQAGRRVQERGCQHQFLQTGPLCIFNSWWNLLPERRDRLLYLLFVVISHKVGGKRRPN